MHKCLKCKSLDELCASDDGSLGGLGYSCSATALSSSTAIFYDSIRNSCTICSSSTPICKRKITF